MDPAHLDFWVKLVRLQESSLSHRLTDFFGTERVASFLFDRGAISASHEVNPADISVRRSGVNKTSLSPGV